MIGKSKEQLADELKELRQRTAELEGTQGERKRMEVKMQESQEKCRVLLSLINSATNPMTLYSSKGIVLLMNATAAKDLDGTADGFVGKSIYEIYPQSIADAEMEKIRQVAESGERAEFESEFELSSGTRWFRSNFQPMKDASDDIFAVQVISYDITERKQAEKALRESEEKHEALTEASPDADAIFAQDREGRYLYINRAGPAIFGRKRADIIGKKLAELFPKEKAKAILEDVLRVFRENRAVQVEQIVPLYEELHYFSTTLGPIHNDKGDVVLVMGMAHDITDEKQAEEKRLAGLKIAADVMASMLDGDGIAITDDMKRIFKGQAASVARER